MNDSDLLVRRAIKLPSLNISTTRSISARISNTTTNQTTALEEITPNFKNSKNQNNSIRQFYLDPNISFLCKKILQEQTALKQKINQQEKIINIICTSRNIHHYHSSERSIPNNQENNEITFKNQMCGLSAKGSKRFKFPREVFCRKLKTRQS